MKNRHLVVVVTCFSLKRSILVLETFLLLYVECYYAILRFLAQLTCITYCDRSCKIIFGVDHCVQHLATCALQCHGCAGLLFIS